jgi:hypothetical protein
MNGYALLAAMDETDIKTPDLVAAWKSNDSSLRQTMIILGAILLVVLGVVVWAVFIRKPRRELHHGRGMERGTLLTTDEQRSHRSGKIRRRRRSRPRAQTLAETGGLPPIRDDASNEDTAP